MLELCVCCAVIRINVSFQNTYIHMMAFESRKWTDWKMPMQSGVFLKGMNYTYFKNHQPCMSILSGLGHWPKMNDYGSLISTNRLTGLVPNDFKPFFINNRTVTSTVWSANYLEVAISRNLTWSQHTEIPLWGRDVSAFALYILNHLKWLETLDGSLRIAVKCHIRFTILSLYFSNFVP